MLSVEVDCWIETTHLRSAGRMGPRMDASQPLMTFLYFLPKILHRILSVTLRYGCVLGYRLPYPEVDIGIRKPREDGTEFLISSKSILRPRELCLTHVTPGPTPRRVLLPPFTSTLPILAILVRTAPLPDCNCVFKPVAVALPGPSPALEEEGSEPPFNFDIGCIGEAGPPALDTIAFCALSH